MTRSIILGITILLLPCYLKAIDDIASEQSAAKEVCGVAEELLYRYVVRPDGRNWLKFFEERNAIKWISPLIKENWIRAEALESLRRIGDPRVVPEILDAIEASITEADKSRGVSVNAIFERYDFQVNAVQTVEQLLGSELIEEKTVFHDTWADGVLKGQARTQVEKFLHRARNRSDSPSANRAPAATPKSNVSTEIEMQLLNRDPNEVARMCNLQELIQMERSIVSRNCYKTKQCEEYKNYMAKNGFFRWLDFAQISDLERIQRYGDPAAVPQVLDALERSLHEESELYGPETEIYRNRRAFQKLAIQTVEGLLGQEMLNEDEVLNDTYANGVLKVQARSKIQEFVDNGRKLCP